MHCCAQWRNICNGHPAKLLINKQIYLPCHSHNDGAPCSNQGVATIFGRREYVDCGVGIRLGPIAYHWVRSRPLTEIRFAFDALATAKKIPGLDRIQIRA